MKILHVIASLSSGGAEKLLVDLVTGMKEKNIECEVLVLSSQNNFFGHIFKEKNIKVYYSNSSKIYSLKNIQFIIDIIRRNQFDLIHTHLYSAQIFSVIAKYVSFSKVPLVTTEHSTNNNRRAIKAFRLLDKIMYSKYRAIVAITSDVQHSLVEYLPGISNKISLIYNGIDLDTYKNALPLERKNLVSTATEDEIWVVMVAGMRPAKDHETLIRASKRLPSNYRVLFVGEGEKLEILKEYALKYGSKKIDFLGARTDVPNILKASDIFVLSSHWEGFGLSLVEAAAAGIPVIASDVPGMNSVAEKINGYLFPQGNDELLLKIIQEADSLAQLEALNEFSISNTIRKYIELYNRIR